MGNFLSLILEIFMIKEDHSTKVGLSAFKNEVTTPVVKRVKTKTPVPKELKISELMRKGCY